MIVASKSMHASMYARISQSDLLINETLNEFNSRLIFSYYAMSTFITYFFLLEKEVNTLFLLII